MKFLIEPKPMIKIFSLLALLLCFCNLNAQFTAPTLTDKPYIPGENLQYTIKFGPIHGGNASIVLKHVKYDNRDLYHARAEGKTVGLTDKIFSVKDVFESYFDPQTSMPYKCIRDVKEGNYKKREEATFDHIKGTAYSLRKDTLLSVPKDILDMVSLLYYLRGLDLKNLKPGDVLKTVTFFDDELFPFDVRYKGKEVIKTKYGKIRCLRFDPVVEPGRIFKSEDDMTAWLSDDKNLIPVKVRFELVVGSVRIDLDDYSNLKYPLEVIKD